jgi:GTPase
VVTGAPTRAGFVALAGRPNVGKSTIVNALVGHKVAIVSDKPQTTRRAIRGVATHGDAQLVLVDLPGVQRPRDALTERMQRRVEHELAESDAALLVLNGEQGVGPGDRFIAERLAPAGVPLVVVVNKVDRLDRARTVSVLAATQELALAGEVEVFPVSARTGRGMEALREHVTTLMPTGPFLFPPEDRTDVGEHVLLAELVREQVLHRTREELPHAVEVEVGEVEQREDGLTEVHAQIWAETESQKGILIGSHGKMIKAIGTAARRELERELGRRVHLDLSVRVRRSWRGDEGLLDRLGIT